MIKVKILLELDPTKGLERGLTKEEIVTMLRDEFAEDFVSQFRDDPEMAGAVTASVEVIDEEAGP